MVPGRDHWYHDLMALPIADPKAATEVMDAEDPLFILYTSGTTGKPKAILHTHGGYMVWTSHHAQMGLRHQAGRCLVVRRRSRLDYRPQLHRLRAADFGRDQLHVRRRTDPSLPRPLVVDGRQIWRHRSFTPRPRPFAG